MKSKPQIVIVTGLALALLLGLLLWFLGGDVAKASRLAGSGDAAERLEAIELLRGKHNDTAREILARLSKDKDLRVSLAAIRALGRDTCQQNRDVLAGLCKEADRARVRGAAAAALGQFKDAPAAELVAVLRSDKDPIARAGAAEGLYHLRDRSAAADLLAAMDDDDLTVRRWATKAFYRTVGLAFLYRPTDPRPKRRAAIAQIRSTLKWLKTHKER